MTWEMLMTSEKWRSIPCDCSFLILWSTFHEHVCGFYNREGEVYKRREGDSRGLRPASRLRACFLPPPQPDCAFTTSVTPFSPVAGKCAPGRFSRAKNRSPSAPSRVLGWSLRREKRSWWGIGRGQSGAPRRQHLRPPGACLRPVGGWRPHAGVWNHRRPGLSRGPAVGTEICR